MRARPRLRPLVPAPFRALVLALWLALASGAEAPAVASAQPAAESYARGYADAILSQVFQLRDYDIVVRGHTLEVTLRDSATLDTDTIARALLRVEGIERVVVLDGGVTVLDERRNPELAADGTDKGWDVFPNRELFAPLLADPRWPHFSAAYQRYLSDSELTNIAAVSFGETFALLRSPRTGVGDFELGFLAGVFSVFDLDAESFDLVNSDYLVGASLAHQVGPVSSLLRFSHQSSHLGDEYLLRNRVDRVNLSYEALDLLISYTPFGWLRLYGGGGLLLHRNPELERGFAQAGLELKSPVAFQSGHLRPLAGVDVQFREESDWATDVSTRLGLQIEHPTLRRLRIQLLGEYYRGYSPVGQFYVRRIETIGAGLHVGF